MAKRPVIEVQCGRCARTEYRPVEDTSPAGKAATPAPVFLALLAGVKVSFDDLCTPCINTVQGHLGQIAKKIDGVSPVRGKRSKKGIEEDVQVDVEEHLPNGG
jgi:hypothetical protein